MKREELTEGLDGGDNQVARKDLTEPRRAPGPAGKSLLHLPDEGVAERCRDEDTVQRNLYGARIDLGTREYM